MNLPRPGIGGSFPRYPTWLTNRFLLSKYTRQLSWTLVPFFIFTLVQDINKDVYCPINKRSVPIISSMWYLRICLGIQSVLVITHAFLQKHLAQGSGWCINLLSLSCGTYCNKLVPFAHIHLLTKRDQPWSRAFLLIFFLSKDSKERAIGSKDKPTS